MRVVTQENVIERNRSLAQISFFFSIAALIAAFLATNALGSENEEVAFYIQCGAMPLLFLVILFSVRMANNWIREPVPWNAVQEALRGISADSTLYHYVMMPARHILVSPHGVYLIYPLFQDRPVVVKGKNFTMPGGLFARILVFMRQEAIGDAVALAELEAEFAQKQINNILGTSIEIQPVITFIHPNAKVMIEDDSPVPVTATESGKDIPTLKEYLKSQKGEGRPTLSEEQVDALDQHFIYE
jgi:uncharacterized membrane protein YhdT